ncbi:MAG: hypothetical protein H6R19_915 [Proteobacteria bacterium]|nr:hypothetical protein [Pseudomonadota bacterium]
MPNFIAFAAQRRVASGNLAEVSRALRAELARTPDLGYLVFDDTTGHTIDLDLRVADMLPEEPAPPAQPDKAGPGRPKLGVVAREITLLPRHWEWLAGQPGGASVALRKLVETASRANRMRDQARASLEACHRFMLTMAGDLPGFEETTRALFAGKFDEARAEMADWPADILEHADTMLTTAQNDAYEARED